MQIAQALSCPNCAANLSADASFCEFCGSEIMIRNISSFHNFSQEKFRRYQSYYQKRPSLPGSKLGLGLCYLKCGNYQLARTQFARAVEENPEIAESYYYQSLALIGGRRIMTISLKEARQIVADLNTALALNAGYIYPRLLKALIFLDYYEMNALTPPEDGEAVLEELADCEFDLNEIETLNLAAPTGDRCYFQ